MGQALDDLVFGQGLEVFAGLAQANAADFYTADLKLLPDQVIKRHTARDDVPTCFTGSDFEMVFSLESLDRFSLDQGKFAIRQRFRKSSLTQGVAVALQPNSRNG